METDRNKVIDMFQTTIYKQDKKPVLMDTLTCITHRFNGISKNCEGCDGEIQCTKMTMLLMLDVLSRTGQIGYYVTSGFKVMEYMVDIVRATDLIALSAILPEPLHNQIISDK